ncbi:antibiotic biosynthesis monooxygenase [Campylobacter concisus]|uniref:putative quinol monooxygenase n=1 Tax=Campylobacter concisus TaxID=199 RepID=UPI0018AC4B5D|nr:antibiotic biosynthesis monooxygenase [Campylobacter concisus]QPI00258.1 antibiotic biosynthesis monooxygenase [Campylobacter concisus]QPI02046.1 antibiotic biosynthesis monooxygenase [Campylobacter concisus]
MIKKLFLLVFSAAFAFGAEAKVSLYELLSTLNNKSLLRQLGRENILSSKSEPGTQAIFFASAKSKPELFYLLEFYKDEAAYKKHISSAHFKKFASVSAEILASKKAIGVKKRAAFSKNLTPERLKDAYFHITNLSLLAKSDTKFEKIIKKYMQKSVDEGAYAQFAFSKKDAPNKWVLVEIYKDEASFESYRHSENYKAYAKERAGLIDEFDGFGLKNETSFSKVKF